MFDVSLQTALLTVFAAFHVEQAREQSLPAC